MREKHRETQGPEPGLPGVEITRHGASYKQGAPLEYKVSGTVAGTRGSAIGAAGPSRAGAGGLPSMSQCPGPNRKARSRPRAGRRLPPITDGLIPWEGASQIPRQAFSGFLCSMRALRSRSLFGTVEYPATCNDPSVQAIWFARMSPGVSENDPPLGANIMRGLGCRSATAEGAGPTSVPG